MVSFAAVVRDALRDIPKDGCERGPGSMVGSVGRWSVFSGHLDSIEAFELLIVLNPEAFAVVLRHHQGTKRKY